MGQFWRQDGREPASREELFLDGLASLLEPARGAGTGEVEIGEEPPYLVILLEAEAGKASIVTSRGEAPASSALLGAALCDAVIEGPDGRRSRTIPPRLRRLALQRARRRCQVAGCLHTQRLEVHHRVPHALGGSTDLENLVVLCRKCHRRLHRGEQQIQASILATELAARVLTADPERD